MESGMQKLVQALVGVAAIAVIAVAYLWVSDRNADRNMADREKAAVRQYEGNERLERCRRDVEAWNNGNQGPALSRYGDNAENGIRLCESLIKINELSRSKPSE